MRVGQNCTYVGDFPAQNTVHTPYMYGSGHPRFDE